MQEKITNSAKQSDFTHENITLIGVGITGNNVINKMIEEGVEGLRYVGVNMYPPYIGLAQEKINILDHKKTYTKEEEKEIMKNSLSKIQTILEGTDLTLIVCDSITTDGSRFTDDIAKLSKSMGILTLVITKDPLGIEHECVKESAEDSKNGFKRHSNSLIVLPSEAVIKYVDIDRMSINEMIGIVDDYLVLSIKSLAEILTKPGDIMIAFEDIKYLFRDSDSRLVGTGCSQGEGRIETAFKNAIEGLGINYDFKKANKILLSITGVEGTLIMEEVRQFIENLEINKIFNENVNYIWGTINNEIVGYDGDVRVTIYIS